MTEFAMTIGGKAVYADLTFPVANPATESELSRAPLCSVGARIECGTVWVNSHLIIMPYLPFGGAKWSGLGVENGPWGLAEFTEPQVVYTAR